VDPQARTIFGHTTTGLYDLLDVYNTPRGWGIAYLDPLAPVNPLAREALYFNFFNVLNRQYPTVKGWNFVGDPRRFSNNSLRVHTYDAEGRPNLVGAIFDVEYRPAGTDPRNNMHWIQVVSDNNNITAPNAADRGPGKLENIVDVKAGKPYPYYDGGGAAANSRNLYDFPKRPDVEFNNSWIAALFLVSGPTTPGRVTIYNDSGILWGWKNVFFPNANVAQFRADVRQEIENQLPLQEVVAFDNEFNQDLAAAAVPEPPTLVLVLSAVVFLTPIAVGARFLAIKRTRPQAA
jgi:hypothetical protein